jgi:hypothetical protein
MAGMSSVPVIYSLDQVAELSHRTVKAVRQLRARQKQGEQVGPRFTKIDGRIYVREEDLAAWLSGEADTPRAS